MTGRPSAGLRRSIRHRAFHARHGVSRVLGSPGSTQKLICVASPSLQVVHHWLADLPRSACIWEARGSLVPRNPYKKAILVSPATQEQLLNSNACTEQAKGWSWHTGIPNKKTLLLCKDNRTVLRYMLCWAKRPYNTISSYKDLRVQGAPRGLSSACTAMQTYSLVCIL